MSSRILNLLFIGALILLWSGGSPALAREFPVRAAADGGARIDQARIRGLLETFLAVRAESLPLARIRFKAVENIKPFMLPAGNATCEIVPSDPGVIASRRFSLIFRVDGRVKANLAVRTELEVIAPVAVAALDLPRGAVIAAGDVYMAERNLSSLREPYLEAESLVGKRVRRALRAGAVLQKGLLETPPVVRRGDLVTMTVRSGGLLLTAQGAARQNGITGETIRVRNSSSKKDVLCQVVGPGQVSVEM